MFISFMSQVKKVIYFELSLSKGKLHISCTVMTHIKANDRCLYL